MSEAVRRRGLFDLTGRVIMANGGNSGIGLAFLTGCVRQGADVVVWDRDRASDASRFQTGYILVIDGDCRVKSL